MSPGKRGSFATKLLGGVALVAVAGALRSREATARRASRPPLPNRRDDIAAVHEHAARRLHGGAAILALAVLGDSGIEHYRGMFKNKAMFTPLVTSTLSVLASLHGLASRRPLSRGARRGVYGLAALTGVVGTAFHVYNVGKRPGGASFENLFYGAPLGAPAALTLAGAVGLAAEGVHAARAGGVPRVLGLPLGRSIAALTAAGLLGTTAEAGLLHFRGNYQHRAMYLPVTLPPAAAALLGWAALRSGTPRPHRLAVIGMRISALLGFSGAAFHARGVSRYMGGWRNWSQNVLDGPPIPAPPAFTGLALAGLAALSLMKSGDE